MLVFGVISLGVALLFVTTASPFEPAGRSQLPTIVLAGVAALAGVGCIVLGARQLVRLRNTR
jgi:hypothetical protein